ncbi:MAG TPA: DUF559 domain-containing protein [Solirubrobacterales bacterium]|jgi:very-short-patch-repair endonuclease|nr:DUF559 domain-containing protein [Solirubrobacterales bacterium]
MTDASSSPSPDPVEVCISPGIGGKCTPPDIDGLISELAMDQHGVVARRQLLTGGVGRRAIELRLERKRLHSVHAGVYAVGHRLLTARGRWMAAVLASGSGAVLSHLTAGQLWDILPSRSSDIEVTRPGFSRKRRHIRAHRSSLADDESLVLDHIPVTSLSRTIFDLAGILDRSGLERAINEAEVRQLTDRLSVPDLLARHPRRRGASRLRDVFADWTADGGITANDFEAAFSALVVSYRLSMPRFNADIAVRGRFFKVDAMWEAQKVIVELDGRAAHGTRSAFERDRERDRLLLLAGWRVVRITWRQLRDTPELIAADLRELLERPATSTLRG